MVGEGVAAAVMGRRMRKCEAGREKYDEKNHGPVNMFLIRVRRPAHLAGNVPGDAAFVSERGVIEAMSGPEAMTWHVAVAGERGAIVVPDEQRCKKSAKHQWQTPTHAKKSR